MKKPLLPALVALALGALVGGARADAQRPQDVTAAESAPAIAVPAPSTPLIAPTPIGPVIPAPTTVTRAVGDLETAAPDGAPLAQGGIRMPTSRVLIIGGTAAAIAGILIGGDVGAIVAVTGTVAAVYGLYLHYR